MIDVHCHLNFHSFEKDYDMVIKQAIEAGVTTIINVGTKIDSSQHAVDLASKYPQLYAIVGVHPHHADKLEPGWENELEQIVLRSKIPLSGTKKPKVVAIGECGMDFYSYKSNGIVDPKLQKEVFIKQILLAHKLKLPIQIHNRHAGKDIVEILLDHKSYLMTTPGMFHCFAGSMEILKKALAMGFYIGFDGNITYKGLAPGEDTDLRDLVKATPLDKIVVETDSPFLTPVPHRGSRNMPSYAIIVAQEIAKIKNIAFEKVEEQTTQNAKTLFKLRPST